jgi:hypothetical protein
MPVLRLECDVWAWLSADVPANVVLSVDAFDLSRALTGRRTADQLCSWVVEGDIEPYLDAFATTGLLPARRCPASTGCRRPCLSLDPPMGRVGSGSVR